MEGLKLILQIYKEGGLRSSCTSQVISKNELKAKTQINSSGEFKLNLNQDSSESRT